MSKIVGVAEWTVRRTLTALDEAGWLRAHRGDITRWEIGARVLAVRPAALRSTSLFPAAREPMVRLRDMLNETVHLSVPDALNEMVVIDRVDCDHPERTFHALGETSPPHATATGHAVLAHMPVTEVDESVQDALGACREETVTDTAELHAERPGRRRVLLRWNLREIGIRKVGGADSALEKVGGGLAILRQGAEVMLDLGWRPAPTTDLLPQDLHSVRVVGKFGGPSQTQERGSIAAVEEPPRLLPRGKAWCAAID